MVIIQKRFFKPEIAHSRSDLRAELYAQIEDDYGPRRSSNLFLTDWDSLRYKLIF